MRKRTPGTSRKKAIKRKKTTGSGVGGRVGAKKPAKMKVTPKKPTRGNMKKNTVGPGGTDPHKKASIPQGGSKKKKKKPAAW